MLLDWRNGVRERYLPKYLESKYIMFVMCLISVMLDLFNVTSILVSIKYIQKHYDVSLAIASWSLSAYAVTFSGFIAFAGRIGDIIGHDNQFVIASLSFSIVSLICAVVDNIYVFIVFRALQGISAAALIPSNYAIVAHIFKGSSLDRALTLLSGMLTISTAGGMVVGGAFLESDVKYRGIFYVSFGLSLILGILAILIFPQLKRNSDRLIYLDYIGSAILIFGLLLIIVGFTEGGESWNSPKAYVNLLVGGLLILAFLLYETFISPKFFPKIHLLIPAQVWKIPNLLPLTFISILNFGGYFGMMYITSSYFLYIEDDSALLSGVKYIPFIVTMLISIIIMTIIYGKFSPKWVSMLGFLIGTGGLVLSSRMDYRINDYYWKFSFTGQVVLSLGSCMYFVHYVNMIITNTPLHYQGVVTGIAQTFAQFGVALAFAVITSITGSVTDKLELHKRYQNGSYFCIACYGLGTILLGVFVHDTKKQEITEEDQELEQVTKQTINETKYV